MKSTGVAVEVRNDTGAQQVAKLALSALSDANGHVSLPGHVCGGITVEPATLTLAAAESGLVTLRAQADGKNGTTYSASLAAAGPVGPAARLALTIAAAPAGTVAPVPLTTALTETIYRGSAHGKDSLNIAVEAKSTDKLALTDGEVVGAVDGGGRTGVVSYQAGTLGHLTAAASTARFVISGLDGATGTFTGKITLVPGNDKSTVTVTVTRKDWWLYPTLAVIAGILLALATQRVAGVLVTGRRLRARLAATGPRYKEARRELVAAAAGEPWAGFTLSDLKQQQHAVETAIADAQRSSYVAITPTKVDGVTAEVAKLEQGIDQLTAVDTHAQPLYRAIDTAANQAGALPREGSDVALVEPVLVTAKRSLLVGVPLSIDALGERLTDLDAATAALNILSVYESTVADDDRHLDELATGLGRQHQREIADAKQKLGSVWHDLWTAPSVDELTTRGVSTRLGVVGAKISELWPLLPSPGDTADLALDVAAGDGTAMILGLQAPGPVDYSTGGVAHELKAARLEQRVVVALSFVVALTTALTTLYINQVFGSFWDYVIAVTWGLAGQTALVALANALDSLGGLNAISRRVSSS